MSKYFFSALTLTLALASNLPIQAENQKTENSKLTDFSKNIFIESKDGHFSIALPKGFVEADEEILPIQTEMGEIETVNYTSFSDTAAAMIGTSQYPDALLVFIRGKEKDVLEGAQEGALKNVNGVVISEKELQVDNFPAKSIDFTAEADDQPLFGRALFVLADSRLYHVLYITSSREEITSESTTNFFNSFKISK